MAAAANAAKAKGEEGQQQQLRRKRQDPAEIAPNLFLGSKIGAEDLGEG